MVTPGAIEPKLALVAATLMMFAILALDLATDADIRLHMLYVFPLAVIGLHCDDGFDVLVGLFLSLICQLFTSLFEGTPVGPLATDALVFFASSLLVVFLAKAVRQKYLESATPAPTGPAVGHSKPRMR